ncbi:MAG TPA: flagellin, partial [bacterium]|nr:flagellin [bacterium]
MRIAMNLAANTAIHSYERHQQNLAAALERLSSGYRINSAADDASGLAVAAKFRNQLGGITQAQTNVETGISLLQTADGAMQEIVNILETLSSQATTAANDTLTVTDRALIQTEVDELLTEIDRLSGAATFNNYRLLRGEINPGMIHAGADANDTISLSIASMTTTTLGVNGLDVSSRLAAESAISQVGSALQEVLTQLANVGASENRLQHSLNYLAVSETTNS